MTSIAIDVTPIAINRTAMYFIIRDTVAHLLATDIDVCLQALGIPIAVTEFVANDFRLPPGVERKIRKRLARLVSNPAKAFRRSYSNSSSATANLVFDPLYILAVDTMLPTIAYVLDLTPITRPEWHDAKVSAAYAYAFRGLYSRNVKIVAISESTARDLWVNFGIPQSRIDIVGLYSRFMALPIHRPEKRFLFVGSLEMRKNVIGLIEAFALSGLQDEGFTLRIVGGDGYGAESIKKAAGGVRGVILCGRLSDAELGDEYARACALVYPSLWEGFGLPALEAKNYGLPLLLADTGALPEVGGDVAHYVDPCSVTSIAAGLVALVGKTGLCREARSVDRRCHLEGGNDARDSYMARITEIVRRTGAASHRDEGCHQDGLDRRAPWLFKPTMGGGARYGFQRLRLRLQRAVILRSRILPVTGETPSADSFSLDYLFCVQQERRLRLSRALARLMHGTLRMYPVYLVQISVAITALVVTNVVVGSLINEHAIRKIAKHMNEGK